MVTKTASGAAIRMPAFLVPNLIIQPYSRVRRTGCTTGGLRRRTEASFSQIAGHYTGSARILTAALRDAIIVLRFSLQGGVLAALRIQVQKMRSKDGENPQILGSAFNDL
jgi:hypothetical protein